MISGSFCSSVLLPDSLSDLVRTFQSPGELCLMTFLLMRFIEVPHLIERVVFDLQCIHHWEQVCLSVQITQRSEILTHSGLIRSEEHTSELQSRI